MQISISQSFVSDLLSLQPKLATKCQHLLNELSQAKPHTLSGDLPKGWRLHKLKSSPFISLSVDMHYRVLAKLVGDGIELHRVVKHDLADSPNVNRNDSRAAQIGINSNNLLPNELHTLLLELGISSDDAAPFKGVTNEDALLRAFDLADNKTSEIALSIYETSGTLNPRSQTKFIDSDIDFQQALLGEDDKWKVYLHSSQQFVIDLPTSHRMIVFGSAGTGKTICGWYRAKAIAERGLPVGFICPTNTALQVSKDSLSAILAHVKGDVFYLVPQSFDQIKELLPQVEHLIIDECQEFSIKWLSELFKALSGTKKGATLFGDLNQLGANTPRGDKFMFKEKFDAWQQFLINRKDVQKVHFRINYRNSEEIFRYYHNMLAAVLPYPIYGEIPTFKFGDVSLHNCSSLNAACTTVLSIIQKLIKTYRPIEIAVVVATHLGGLLNQISIEAVKQHLPISMDLDKGDFVSLIKPGIIRGHERKAVIVVIPTYSSLQNNHNKLGRIIDTYIALSRARETLAIVQLKDYTE